MTRWSDRIITSYEPGLPMKMHLVLVHPTPLQKSPKIVMVTILLTEGIDRFDETDFVLPKR